MTHLFSHAYAPGEVIDAIGRGLQRWGQPVDTGHWQGLKDVPQVKTIELQNVVLDFDIPADMERLHQEVGANQPWAEAQFLERVAGEPVNPGETYKDWPYYKGNVETHKQGGQFSHTYMERFWPQYAGYGYRTVKSDGSRMGIRYRYGDLDDVVALLAKEPTTRQAYLPIFFPEDTGAHHGERIPCTLGYHFMMRNGFLNITYFIRSCDFYRHMRDDIYMAARLCQWVLKELQTKTFLAGMIPGQEEQYANHDLVWKNVSPGTLTMHMCSLHVFEGDLPKLRREYGEG